jgi:5-methylcytosine-specific restriction endonuclease McrA
MHPQKNTSLSQSLLKQTQEQRLSRLITPPPSKKMDSRYGGFGGHGQSSRLSRYSHSASHHDEDDYRHPQHRRGGRKGHQCQYCGLDFDAYNDMIHHVQTECMVRYSYYPKDLPPGPGEGHSAAEMHFAATSRNRSATRSGHPHPRASVFGSIESSAHGSRLSADYSNRASSSGLPPEGFDTTAVTPLRRLEQQVELTHNNSDTHSSRSVSFSPTSGQAKPVTRELQKDTLSHKKMLDEPQPLFRLLSAGELSSLSVQDRALCQSVVLFCSKGGSPEKNSGDEKFGNRSQSHTPFQSFDSPPRAGPVHTSKTTKNEAGHTSVIEGKLLVGFQCAYCISSLASPSQGGTPFARVFPGSIETIAASLNLVKERHFQSPPRTGSNSQTPSPSGGQGGCLCLPSDVRNVFEAGRNQSSYKPPETRYEEATALQVACQNLAHRLGVDNKQPHKTGIVVKGSANEDNPDPPQFGQHEAPLQNRQFSTTRNLEIESGVERHPFERRPASSGSGTFGYGSTMEHSASFDMHHPPILSHRTSEATRPDEALFVRDSYGWCCPYCSTLPYNFRSPGYFTREPPAVDFMNKHFAVCTGLSGGERNYDQGGRVPHGAQYSYPHGYPYPPGAYGGPQSGRNRAPSYHASAYDRSDHGQSDRFGHSQLVVQHFRGHSSGPSESPREATEASIRQAIDFLASLDEENPDEGQLVLPDDKLLLTDYFFYLNKQLKECRFTEKDRKTRGGKREKIELGFGGLQCRHCAGTSGSRKFFWSDVDRLANSFAEIPGHILKCRKCPDEVKNALTELKLKHPEQMARLPRGSQKVFFRRMWKRLHRQDLDSLAQNKSSLALKLEGGGEKAPEEDNFTSGTESLKRSATHNESEDPKRQRCDEPPSLDQL